MIQIIAFILFLAGILLMARVNTSYHPKLIFKKHISIKNEALSRLLIMNTNPENFIKDNQKNHRNKLLLSGLIFYLLWILLVLFSVIMIFGVSSMETTPLIINTEWNLIIHTVNVKLPCLLGTSLFFAELLFLGINIINCEKTLQTRFWKIIWICFLILIALCIPAPYFLL